MFNLTRGLRAQRSTLNAVRRLSSTASGSMPKAPKRIGTVAAGMALAATTYTLGSLYPPTLVELMYPPHAPASPSELSEEGQRHIQLTETELQGLPIVRTLRAQSSEYYETRPYEHYPEEKRIHSLTAGTLRGPGKLAVKPIIFAKWDESESIVIVHLGRSLCGHDGIIHGGMLATLLDESLARNAILNLPSKVGVTANLSLNYKAPTKADQFVVIRTKVESAEGRKVTVSGRIEDLAGNALVEAKSLFVEPKYAKLLNTEALSQVLGRPPKPGHPVPGVDVAVTS